MSGAIENLKQEKNLQTESWNWVNIGKNADKHVSDTQEHLGETLEQKKYKEQTINYWLNEVFWLPEKYKSSLKARGVDFNKRISIKELLNEIELEDEELNLRKALIILADESLNKSYYTIFEDYLTYGKGIQISSEKEISIKEFLELLSWFDKENIQTLSDWAGDGLMHDDCSKFEIYCRSKWRNFSDFVCDSTYRGLLKDFQQEEKEKNNFYSL